MYARTHTYTNYMVQRGYSSERIIGLIEDEIWKKQNRNTIINVDGFNEVRVSLIINITKNIKNTVAKN